MKHVREGKHIMSTATTTQTTTTKPAAKPATAKPAAAAAAPAGGVPLDPEKAIAAIAAICQPIGDGTVKGVFSPKHGLLFIVFDVKTGAAGATVSKTGKTTNLGGTSWPHQVPGMAEGIKLAANLMGPPDFKGTLTAPKE